MELRRLVMGAIVATGVASVTTQLVSLRELLCQFQGNEITISLTLFCWLLLTGLGSLLARPVRRISIRFFALLSLVAAVWPQWQILGIRILREALFLHGYAPGFYAVLGFVLLTLAPYGLLIGFMLPCAQKVLQYEPRPLETGTLYAADNVGDMLGGGLFTILLVVWFKPLTTLAVACSFLAGMSLLLLRREGRGLSLILGALAAGVVWTVALWPQMEIRTLQREMGRILRYEESPYGRIVITAEGSQHTFWESGLPLFSEGQVVESEERVHYALSQLDRVEDVLLISGGVGEVLREMAKYRPRRIDYVELDPVMIRVGLEAGLIPRTPSLRMIHTDGRYHLRKTTRQYDAVIVGLPDPDTFQLNRFYTREFFSLAKRVLRRGGVLCLSLAYPANYQSPVQIQKLATLLKTGTQSFDRCLVIPGERAYFLFRDGPLSPDIPARLKRLGISTRYVQGYFRGNVTPERLERIRAHLVTPAGVNRDVHPRLLALVFKEWFIRHGTFPVPFFAGLGALTLAYIFFMRREEFVLFSTGFVSMGAEILTLFTFQILFGYLYKEMGAVVTGFLVGLFPGALLGQRVRKADPKWLAALDLLIMGLLALFFGAFQAQVKAWPMLFVAYGLALSFLCGLQFPLAARLIGESQSPAAACLGADLCGAALGALVTGTLLVPFWGIYQAVLCLMAVKAASALLLLLRLRPSPAAR